METVEIVIRLPKDEYEEIKETNTIKEHLNKIDWAVRNGIVLPKNHGRLIDADERRTEINEEDRWVVDLAETIIEADKEGT